MLEGGLCDHPLLVCQQSPYCLELTAVGPRPYYTGRLWASVLRVMGAGEELEAGAAKVDILKGHSSPVGNTRVGAGQCLR